MMEGPASTFGVVNPRNIFSNPAFDTRHAQLDPEQVSAIIQGIAHGTRVEPPILWKDPAAPLPRYYVVDGWHRLNALAQSGGLGFRPVRCTVLACGRAEAILEAKRRRSMGSLVLSSAERADAAWRLVLTDPDEDVGGRWAYSVPVIARACGVSTRTVGTMRQRRGILHENRQEPTGNWRKDRCDWLNEKENTEMTDAARAAFIREVSEVVRAALLPFRHKDDTALFLGIEAGLGRKAGDLLDFLRGHEEDLYDDPFAGADPSGDGTPEDGFADF